MKQSGLEPELTLYGPAPTPTELSSLLDKPAPVALFNMARPGNIPLN
jgi:hypothetical protein